MSLNGVFVQSRVVVSLILREMRTRYGDKYLGVLWLMTEPAIHVGLLLFIKSFVFSGMGPQNVPYSVFLITGLLPFFMVRNIAIRVMVSVRGNRALLAFPMLTLFDLALSRMMFEFIVYGGVMLIFLFIFWYFGVPFEIEHFTLAMAFLPIFAFLGLGAGILFRALYAVMPNFEILAQSLFRILYFSSGVMFSIENLPLRYHNLLAVNPLVHMLETFRSIMFMNYHTANAFGFWTYGVMLGAVCLITGMVFERRWAHRILSNDA